MNIITKSPPSNPLPQGEGGLEWKISTAPVDYPAAVETMERRVEDILAGRAAEMVWLLEHPPLYTAGTSANAADLLDARFPVYPSGRGGQFTYHGPGQRVAYAMLDLNRRGRDVRTYVHTLEQWIIATLARFGVEGFTHEGRVGVWVNRESGIGNQESEKKILIPDARYPIPDFGEAKIAAIGIRVRKWVAYHGISVNVHPDLSHYGGIVPCGIADAGVTSLKALGADVSLTTFDRMLREEFGRAFH